MCLNRSKSHGFQHVAVSDPHPSYSEVLKGKEVLTENVTSKFRKESVMMEHKKVAKEKLPDFNKELPKRYWVRKD